MAEQVNEIVEAQLSRGLKLDQGNFFARIRKYVPILIPIIILSIKRSIEVAESLEIRGVDPNIKRIHYVALKLSMRDIVYFLVNLGLVIVVYLASSYISSESLIALLHFSKI
jgi:energy-coupling factor transport system permease protein